MSMHYCQQGRVNPTVFVVECKGRRRHIPCRWRGLPERQHRCYRPGKVFVSFPSHMLAAQNTNHAQHRGVQRGIRRARRKD